ncbi:hypothetical protein B1748_23485 [Paenibacillus sp. MY03]|nr:hypothetical protein B1748_23485 [Paenibacillus sp. MY03]
MDWFWWSLYILGAIFCIGCVVQIINKNRKAKREFQEWLLPAFLSFGAVCLIFIAIDNFPVV